MHWKPTFCYKGHDQYKTNEKAFVYLNQIDDLKLRDIKPMMWFVCLLSTKWSLSCFGTLAKWPIFHSPFWWKYAFVISLSHSLCLSLLSISSSSYTYHTLFYASDHVTMLNHDLYSIIVTIVIQVKAR